MPDSGLTPVVVPQVSVNEEWVGISRIAVPEGARVAAGDVLFSLSTDKADMDVEADQEGHFWPCARVGDRVKVGDPAGFLTRDARRPESLPAPSAREEKPRATRKAEALAGKLGVDLSLLDVRGIIRERDVEAYAATMQASPAVTAAAPRGPVGAGGPGGDEGRVDADFLASIQKPDSGFALLPGEEKVRLYREHGAVIGRRVTFAPGSALFAESIVVGDDCEFGANTVIRAQTLRIGTGGLFGHDNDILCRHLDFGEMLFLVNRVLIGQGGAFNEESSLTVGHTCLISSDCLINTAHRVVMGDRTCLSPRVSIYTHSHWQNVLEGYRARFAPVTLGNDVWVTGNCLVTPGTVMEDGSQALANSVVSGHVPARTIVSGVPARPISTVRGGLSHTEKDEIMRGIWKEVERAVRHAGLDPDEAIYAGDRPGDAGKLPVIAAFAPRPEGYDGTYFDLSRYEVTGPRTPLSDEVRNVLRKHGIRFEPHLWRYRGDVGRFNA